MAPFPPSPQCETLSLTRDTQTRTITVLLFREKLSPSRFTIAPPRHVAALAEARHALWQAECRLRALQALCEEQKRQLEALKRAEFIRKASRGQHVKCSGFGTANPPAVDILRDNIIIGEVI